MRRAPKRQSKIGLLLIVIAMLVTVIANGIRVANLKAKSERLAVTERQLETEIEDAHKKADDLAEKEKYMQTKKYIEDEAKDKLGLVYPDEIVIEPREK
ncbi:MAG: septum formation initiator family protein [Eubacterium sp.]|nr:septum formation initiator family protein [Eubacterium sp.]MCR5292098.1 septum formation initiator family protein [Eubacterium sp.]